MAFFYYEFLKLCINVTNMFDNTKNLNSHIHYVGVEPTSCVKL